MPKISVLIPTYNRPFYLREALKSVLNQTFQPYEIIIADDNVEDREKNFYAVLPYLKKYPHIKFVQNIKNLGGAENYKNLFFLASGDYIKYLAEDDILYPKNLEILSLYLKQDEHITLATSRRDVLDEMTEQKIDIPATKLLYEHNTIVDGKLVIKKSLQYLKNFIGEFSTYMFRKKDIDFKLFQCCGYEFQTNADWFLWMMLAKKGKIAYHAQPLSCFRYGSSNGQMSPYHIVQGFKETLWFISDTFLSYVDIKLDNKFIHYDKLFFYLSKILQYEGITREEKMELLELIVDVTKNEIDQCMGIVQNNINTFVSVIIVTYNNADIIYDCLQSLLHNLSKNDEIIIVDNNSCDDTVTIIKDFDDKRIKLIESVQNLGYAKGINLGIKQASKEYLIFLNPDTIVTKEFSKRLIAPLQNGEFAISSPLSTYVASFQQLSTYSHIEPFSNYFSYDEISDYLFCLYRNNPYEESKLLIGFCIALHKNLFEEVGGLDEDLFLGNDDLEFSWRLQLQGYKQAIVKTCFIYHKGHESFKKSGTVAEKLVQESTNMLAKKLIEYYGYGKVPLPEELWGISWFTPSDLQFAFMFRWSKNEIDFAKIDKQLKKNMFSIAIVMVNYKNWKDTKACVESLKRMDYKNFKIIVVDNSEESIETLQAYYGNEYTIINEKENIENFSQPIVIRTQNLGFSYANNVAIKKIRDIFDYIWILNNDTIVSPNTLTHMLEVSLKTDKSLITCKIKDYIQKDLVQYNGIVYDYNCMQDKPQRIQKAKFFSGANVLMRSSLYDEVGLWSEEYFLYFEDTDLFMRLKLKGYELIYTPFTSIYHKGGASIGKWKQTPLSMYYAIRNKALLQKKFEREVKEDFFRACIQDYFVNIKNKALIRSLLTAIIDTFVNTIGKTFNKEFIEDYNKKYEGKLRKKYENIEDKKLLELYRECMRRPRDKEKFLEFLKYVQKHKDKMYENFCCIDHEK